MNSAKAKITELQAPPEEAAPAAGYRIFNRIVDWITNGFPGSAMPAFSQKLSDAQRWDLVNFIRTLAPKNHSENQTQATP